jgi:hypothetical protein
MMSAPVGFEERRSKIHDTCVKVLVKPAHLTVVGRVIKDDIHFG